MSRNPHKPTPETNAQVEALCGYGVREDEIALYLGIDPKTLRKYYRAALDKGTIKANVAVARALHKNATDSNNVSAQIFWMKTRGGWKETAQAFEHTGPGGGPIATLAIDPIEAAAQYQRVMAGKA